MVEKSVLKYIKEKYADAAIFESSCFDKPGRQKCEIHLQNCKDYIILKGEEVRKISGSESNKVCDCMIIITNKNRITHLVLVEIDEGKNKKPSHAREQLMGGFDLAKSILQNDYNPIQGNYKKKYIFLYRKIKSHKLREFRESDNYIDGKPIQLEQCNYAFDCTLY
ncbi:MAG: hypothetical protein HQK99_10535 [Nitrospirae bacterium]|nr:hypothetical protein [Nitrospirota bacterium]